MTTALLTNYLAAYRMPLYERLCRSALASRSSATAAASATCRPGSPISTPSSPARRSRPAACGPRGRRSRSARRYEAVIAPFAGGAILPAAYAGARAHRRRFVLWASVWAQPRSLAHALALPATRHIYRHADAVVAYGEHVRRFVARSAGRDDDVFVAPQSVEPRAVRPPRARRRRSRRSAAATASGTARSCSTPAGSCPRRGSTCCSTPGAAGRAPRDAGGDRRRAAARRGWRRPTGAGCSACSRAPSWRWPTPPPSSRCCPRFPTPRFREPWGLVCNEAMHQGRPVIATTRSARSPAASCATARPGWSYRAGDALGAAEQRSTACWPTIAAPRAWATPARRAVAAYTYDAMADAFDRRARSTLARPRRAHWPDREQRLEVVARVDLERHHRLRPADALRAGRAAR